MLRLFILLFTISSLLLPLSGYANDFVPVEKTLATAEVHKHSNAEKVPHDIHHDDSSKCQMVMSANCPNCSIDDGSCNIDCCSHCASHVASIPSLFNDIAISPQSAEISTAFKHFYSFISSLKQRPPLA